MTTTMLKNLLSIRLTAAALVVLASRPAVLVAGAMTTEQKPDVSAGSNWFTMPDGLEFQPASSKFERLLLGGSGSTSGYESEFIDGSETYYNDYAQAWRLLGFYTDCNAPHNNFNECDGDGDNGGGGSGDDDQVACQRYLLWAAYIDPNYSGGGIGEYQFYDRSKQGWDKTSCVAQSGRCAKMDCHLQGTHFELLGFFKEPNYHEWMEQLFKHQGVCLWTDDEYSFMSQEWYFWPCYCTATGQTDENGNALYYDTKPMPEARIGLGLYTDSRCKYDYTGELDVATVLENSGSEYVSDLEQNLEKWNDAFDVYKICQPCKAYDLGYNSNSGGNRQGGEDENGNQFDCYDDADYVNVNQCMKFKTKTEMLAADFRDIMLAHEQGNIVEFELAGSVYGYGGYTSQFGSLETSFDMEGNMKIPVATIAYFVAALAFLTFSVAVYLVSRHKARRSIMGMKVPLVNNKTDSPLL